MKRTHKAMLAVTLAAAISIPGWLLVASPVSDEKHSQMGLASIEHASENSRIITDLEKSVEILDKRVNEALELAEYRLRTLRFIPVVVTAYNPVVPQTDSTPQITASNKPVRPGIVALSRDLEEEFGFKFGDTVFIDGIGSFVFEDRMNKRWKRRVDILMFSKKHAKQFGVRYSFLLVGKSGATSSSVTQMLTNPCVWNSDMAKPIRLDYPDTFYPARCRGNEQGRIINDR